MTKSRNLLWMDVIKVFSTFLIVMNHSISNSFTTLPVSGHEWKSINFIFMISRMGLPVFIMCSGAGMLSREHAIKEIWHKNILGLLKVYVGWMAVLGVRDVAQIWIQGENANVRVMVNAFIKCILFGKYHTWFVFTLLGLYAITPFLYEIVQKKELLFYFLLLSTGFTIILPMFSEVEQLDRFIAVTDSINMHFVVGYSLYFTVGYFICRCMDRRWEKYAEIVFVFSVAIAYGLSIFMSFRAGSANQEAYGLFSPCGFMMSVSLLVIFKKYIGEERQSEVINGIAALQKYGIAIYLIHVMFVEVWTKGEGSGLVNVLTAMLIWALSLGIGMIVYRIPLLSRVLFIRRREKR